MIGATRYAILMIVASAFPATLHAQIHEPYKEAMKDKGWLAPYESLHDRSWLNTLVFGDDTIWETDDDCTALKSGMGIFLSNAPMYYAQRPAEDMFAETLKVTLGDDYEFIVAFVDDDSRSGDAWLADILHEGWHYIHEDTVEGTGAAAAESCARLRLEDEDPPCGAGADCGGGETPKPKKVCTEQQVYVRWTVWVSKWEVIGFEWATVYDPLAGDGETREQALVLVRIYRTWFEQEERGEWRTETVCTTVSS